jgi:hypothetical protein
MLKTFKYNNFLQTTREVLEIFKNIFGKKNVFKFSRKSFKEYALQNLKVFKKFHEKYV